MSGGPCQRPSPLPTCGGQDDRDPSGGIKGLSGYDLDVTIVYLEPITLGKRLADHASTCGCRSPESSPCSTGSSPISSSACGAPEDRAQPAVPTMDSSPGSVRGLFTSDRSLLCRCRSELAADANCRRRQRRREDEPDHPEADRGLDLAPVVPNGRHVGLVLGLHGRAREAGQVLERGLQARETGAEARRCLGLRLFVARAEDADQI